VTTAETGSAAGAGLPGLCAATATAERAVPGAPTARGGRRRWTLGGGGGWAAPTAGLRGGSGRTGSAVARIRLPFLTLPAEVRGAVSIGRLVRVRGAIDVRILVDVGRAVDVLVNVHVPVHINIAIHVDVDVAVVAPCPSDPAMWPDVDTARVPIAIVGNNGADRHPDTKTDH